MNIHTSKSSVQQNLTAERIIELLQLKPHPEGGYFSEVYRANEVIGHAALPPRYTHDRHHSTAIYYLLTPDTCSTMHLVESDEVFHFYLGDTVEQLRLFDDGSSAIVHLGHDIEKGQQPLSVVPRKTWQGARLVPGGAVALLGATVAPGFDYADYHETSRQPLIDRFPQHKELITALTRK